MGDKTMTKQSGELPHNPLDSIDEYVRGLVHDSAKVLYDLDRVGSGKYSVIEFYAEVPERPDASLYIALVERWEEVSKYFGKPVRVYTYLYNEKSEKYIQKLLGPHDNLYITVLPGYMRKVTKL